MISNAILYVIYFFVSGIGLLLSNTSDVTANASLTAGVSSASGYLGVAYAIMPGTTVSLLVCLGVLLVFELALATYKIVKWGYQKIPGIT